MLHTSVRSDIWTRKLTFEDGAVLETTDEHPLYVGGRGFVKAQEVGIGSSIVTRAGPSAKVVAVQADVRRATVYNFTVADYHTYFVGQGALWAHNQNCPQAHAEPVDPSLTHLDQDFAKHMYEGEDVSATSYTSPFLGEWNGKGAHTWEAVEGRVVNAKDDVIYSIKNVREDPLTGARSVDVERLGVNPSGRLTDVGQITPSIGKTLWPKGMSQAEINIQTNTAFGTARIDLLENRWFGQATAPNGSIMKIEGRFKTVNGVNIPIQSFPSNPANIPWPNLPQVQW